MPTVNANARLSQRKETQQIAGSGAARRGQDIGELHVLCREPAPRDAGAHAL
jgi:hypothetical protein